MDWKTETDIDALKLFAKEIGLDVKGNFKAETLRARIGEKLGEPIEEFGLISSPENEGDLVEHFEEPTERFDGNSLLPSGRWGGRRRRIVLNNPYYRIGGESKATHYIVMWESEKTQCWIPFENAVDIPYPHYHILKNQIVERPQMPKVNPETGEQRLDQAKWVAQPEVTFQDLGDTPGTEHLPESMKEIVLEKLKTAELNVRKNFEGVERINLKPMLTDIEKECIMHAPSQYLMQQGVPEEVAFFIEEKGMQRLQALRVKDGGKMLMEAMRW